MALYVFVQIRRVLARHHNHLGMFARPVPLGRAQLDALAGDIRAQPQGPAPKNFTAHGVVDVAQGEVEQADQGHVRFARGKRKTAGGQRALILDLQPQIRTQGAVGAHDHFIADERIHVALTERFQSAVQIRRQDQFAIGIKVMDLLSIRIAIDQHHFFAFQVGRQRRIIATSDHHRTVGHIVTGKRQRLDAPLKAAGTAEDVNIAAAQGLDGIVAVGKTHHFHGHRQFVADQAQVVGTDALEAIAITGDVEGFVVSDRDPDPQATTLLQPLTVLGSEGQWRQVDEGRHQTERQTLRRRHCLAEA